MKKPDIFDLLADIPSRVIDQDAFTVAEMAAASRTSKSLMRERAQAMVKEGKWERVYKKVGHVVSPAYRKAHAKPKN